MAANEGISGSRLGLRSYDIAVGFRNLESTSALLGDHRHTHVAGMAAQLAGAIKGHDVIQNAAKLRDIAAEVMKISPFAFDTVVRELAELELIRNVRFKGGEVNSFSEQIPLIYDDVHDRVGHSLQSKRRTEREEQLVTAVDLLSQGPMSSDDLRDHIGTELHTDPRLNSIAVNSELVQHHTLKDGTVLTVSPLYAFEKPDRLVTLLEGHSIEDVRDAFGRVQEHPGVPVVEGASDPILEEMIRLGLVHAPTVKGADNRSWSFVIMPYGLDTSYLTSKKQVLEKALALIACIRCGQVSGGVTSIRNPDKLLEALSDPGRNYTLAGHSSTPRQYATLIRMGVIKLVPKNERMAAQLVVSQTNRDNLEAVSLARTLLARHGAGPPERANESEAARLLFTGEEYLSSIQTIASVRKRTAGLDNTQIIDAWSDAMGW